MLSLVALAREGGGQVSAGELATRAGAPRKFLEAILLDLRKRGFECYVADPNLWVPFDDGTSFGQWLDHDRTQRNLEDLGVVPKDIEGYWAYEELFDAIRRKLRTGARRLAVAPADDGLRSP